MSTDTRPARSRTAVPTNRIAGAAIVMLSALALVLGLAPVASAQSGSTRLGDFDFTATLATAENSRLPGATIRVNMLARNHQSGFPYTPSVLNTYGVTMPSGFVGVGGGGNHMGGVGDHGRAQNNFWGGQPSLVDRSVGRGSTRDGWLTMRIPENTQGGTTYQFGIMAHLGTGGSWNGPTNNVMRFTVPQVGTRTSLSVSPAVIRVGEEVTLTARVDSTAGSNTPTGQVNFAVGGQDLSANVSNGVATTTTTFDTAGNFPVTASFSPTTSARWHNSNATGTVRVQTEATQTDLTLDPVEVLAGGTVQASASVTPAGAEGEIEFAAGNTTTIVPVSADGTATAELSASTTGEMTVTATFIPTNPQRYTESSDSRTVDVFEQTSTSTEVSVEADPVRAGRETTLTATVSPETAAGTVDFVIDDQTYPATVTNGTATLDHTFATAGEHVVVADFTPTNTDRYLASSGQVTVNVEAETTQTTLALDPVEVTAGGTITATAQITPADADGEVRFDYGDQTQTVEVTDGQATTTFTAGNAGTGTITATFLPDDTERYTESSDTQTVGINAEATQTGLTLDSTEVIEGGTVRATASVTPAGAEGEVEFATGDTTISVPVGADGTAAADLATSAAGQVTVTATFIPADPERYAGSSDSQTVNVLEQITTSTSLVVDADPVRAGEETTLTATVTPANAAGTVTFTIDGQELPAAVVNGVATLEHTFTTAGQYPVTAHFTPTDANRYIASGGQATVNVESEATQTELTLDAIEVTAGDMIQATATVTPAGAGGEIEFTDGETTISVPVGADGTATTELPAEAAGQLTVTATFIPANLERYSGSSDTQTVDITAAATQTALTLDPVQVTAGGTVTATATITPADADGHVRFDYGDQTQTITVSNGTATVDFTTEAAGTDTVTATFLPTDPNRYSTSSDAETVNVEAEATQTELTVGADPRAGEDTTLTATVTPAGAAGTVTFTIGNDEYPATVSDGVATLDHTFTAAGTYPVGATFTPANTDRYSGSAAQATVDVEVETTTTALTLDPVQITAGGAITATANVTPADANGHVRFDYGDQTQTVTVSNGTATADFTTEAAGTGTITATFVPVDSERYTTSSDTETVNVDAEATHTALTLDAAEVTVGETVTATASVTPAGVGGEIEFTAGGTSIRVPVGTDGVAVTELPATAAGQLRITATFIPSDTDRYSGSTDTRAVVVQADAVAEVTSLALDSGTAEAGAEVTLTATVDPADAEGTVRFTIDGVERIVPVIDGVATLVHVAGERGSYTVRAEFLPTDPEAYAPSTDTETLTVTDESDPGTDPGVPAAGSLSLIGLIGSIGSAGVGLHSAVSLGSLGS